MFENMTEDQVSEMKAAKEKLMNSAQKLFEKVYQQQAQGGQGFGGDQGYAGGEPHREDQEEVEARSEQKSLLGKCIAAKD